MAVYTTASHSWAVGETVTAAIMNSQLRDFLNAFGGLTSFTPTWASSGTAPVLGNGTLTGNYSQINKRAFVQITLTAGSTTTFGTGTYNFSLPFTIAGASSVGALAGSVVYNHAGAVYLGVPAVNTGTSIVALTQPTAGPSSVLSATSPATWASGDSITINATMQTV